MLNPYKEGFENYLPAPEFKDIKQIFEKIIQTINNDFELSEDLASVHSIINFSITDIDKVIQIHADKIPAELHFYNMKKASVEISAAFEDFHLYWCHQINLMEAIAKGKIKISGPVTKILSLGQVVERVRDIYIDLYNGKRVS